jgi:IMP dehydrogenase
MDTVTEARLAIAIAQEGGIGIVHKNLSAQRAGGPGGQGQALRVRRAARSGGHHARAHGAPGDAAVGRSSASPAFRWSTGGKVVGIVTGRDLRFETRYDEPVSDIMTPRDKLITVPEGTTPLEAARRC